MLRPVSRLFFAAASSVVQPRNCASARQRRCASTTCNVFSATDRRRRRRWTLSARQQCDLEQLTTGGFAPLHTFMNREQYESVLDTMRLPRGGASESAPLFPIPVVLDVDERFADDVRVGEPLDLCDDEGHVRASIVVGDKWRPDRRREALAVYDTLDDAHPGVNYLQRYTHPVYIAAAADAPPFCAPVPPPLYRDYRALRHTPAQLRAMFAGERVVAFQTRNPMHRAHQALTLEAARRVGADRVLLHPVTGPTKPGDLDYHTRIKCYRAIADAYASERVPATLSLLNLAMRMAGPREALWHALVRRNYGASHFIVGRDHAGPGDDRSGRPFYEPDAAQQLAQRYEGDLGIGIVPFSKMVYVPSLARYVPEADAPAGEPPMAISGTELRRRLDTGAAVPAWFTQPRVVELLRAARPPLHERGLTILFTGLSGSGKSTVANEFISLLYERTARRVVLLDGDVVRQRLSSGLGFTRADRFANVQRIGYVASLVNRCGGVAVCAPIAPYAEMRREMREMNEYEGGSFVEVFVDTPLDECERRDVKGLYAKARAGTLKGMTGIDDPYERPAAPDVRLADTHVETPAQSAERVWRHLVDAGLMRESAS